MAVTHMCNVLYAYSIQAVVSAWLYFILSLSLSHVSACAVLISFELCLSRAQVAGDQVNKNKLDIDTTKLNDNDHAFCMGWADYTGLGFTSTSGVIGRCSNIAQAKQGTGCDPSSKMTILKKGQTSSTCASTNFMCSLGTVISFGWILLDPEVADAKSSLILRAPPENSEAQR